MGLSDKSPTRMMVETTLIIMTYMVICLFIGLNLMGYGINFTDVLLSALILFVAMMVTTMIVDYLDGKLILLLKKTAWYQAELEAEDKEAEETMRKFNGRAQEIKENEERVERVYGFSTDEIRVLRVDLMDERDLEYLGESIKRKGG